MVKKLSFFVLSMLCLFNMQCDEDTVQSDDIITCDALVVINEAIYNDLDSDNFQFINAALEDDCLEITFGASGCDGNTWTYSLIDSGAVAESFPEQRFLKFQLKNEETCTAYFEKTVSFNIEALQVEGSNKIILNIAGADSSINYPY